MFFSYLQYLTELIAECFTCVLKLLQSASNTEYVTDICFVCRLQVQVNPCCENYTCECVFCIDEGNVTRDIGETWKDYSDPNCITKVC